MSLNSRTSKSVFGVIPGFQYAAAMDFPSFRAKRYSKERSLHASRGCTGWGDGASDLESTMPITIKVPRMTATMVTPVLLFFFATADAGGGGTAPEEVPTFVAGKAAPQARQNPEVGSFAPPHFGQKAITCTPPGAKG